CSGFVAYRLDKLSWKYCDSETSIESVQVNILHSRLERISPRRISSPRSTAGAPGDRVRPRVAGPRQFRVLGRLAGGAALPATVSGRLHRLLPCGIQYSFGLVLDPSDSILN